MKQPAEKTTLLSVALFILYAAFFAGLIFSWRAVSSMATGLLFITGFIYNRQRAANIFSSRAERFFCVACSAYFILQLLLYFTKDNSARGWQELILKSGLVFLPLAVCFTRNFIYEKKHALQQLFCLLLMFAAAYCLAKAFISYSTDGASDHFFYHPLVHPLKQHAVYFSLLVYFALLCQLEGIVKQEWFISKPVHYLSGIFLIVFLVLLASKLVLSFFAVTVLYYLFLFQHWEEKRRPVLLIASLGFAAGMCALLLTSNPVSKRFRELFNGDMRAVTENVSRPDEYFNGLQFRVLQWRLVPEILNEQRAWLWGTGAGHSQDLLIQKYSSRNMYTGASGSPGGGYGLYNTHNQWLESLLKNGVAGLIAFFLVCFGLLKIAIKQRKRVLSFAVIVLFLYSFTEALLETQYGLIIFVFFPLFFSIPNETTLQKVFPINK